MYNNFVEQTLQFMLENLKRLPSFKEFWNENESDFITGSDKIVTESILLLFILYRNESIKIQHDIVLELIEILSGEARSKRNASIIMRFPQLSLSLGLSHILLKKMEFVDEDFDFLFVNSLNHPSSESGEKLPFRSMDAKWAKNLYSNSNINSSSVLKFYGNSILTSAVSPTYMQRDDFYALTHCIMYLTDFGQAPFPIKNDLLKICGIIDDSIKWNLHEKDFDLLSELILSRLYLYGELGEIGEIASQFLLESWKVIGFLPSRSLEISAFEKLQGNEKDAYLFANVYHTTYVGLMLLSELDYRGLVVNEKNHPSIDDETQQLVKSYTTRFQTNSSAREWIPFLLSAPLSETDKRKNLVDVFLIAALKSYDLDIVVELLEYSEKKGFRRSEIIGEAYKYLSLQELADGSFGAHFLITKNMESEVHRSFKERVRKLLGTY